jgi:hypothetical protein
VWIYAHLHISKIFFLLNFIWRTEMTKVNQDDSGQQSTPLIATMYERWTLDYIIELVQLIAMDFVCRPRQYREVPPEISELLQNFRFLTGTNPKFPNRTHRSIAFEALLGLSDGMGMVVENNSKTPTPVAVQTATEGTQFKMQSGRLREAARAYTERQVTQGEGQLLQAFLDEAVTLI